MARWHPIRRLVDGSPDDSGRRISIRMRALLIPMISGANAAGAAVVFVLITWVVPTPPAADRGEIVLANLIGFTSFAAVAIAVGIAIGEHRLNPTRTWLHEDRRPDAAEQRAVLRAPVTQSAINGVLWGIGLVVFTTLNLFFSIELAVVVAITVALGGLTTCAVSYLLLERISRAAVARALAGEIPEHTALPGLATRAMLAWLLGTAMPIVGLVLVAIASLAGRDVDERQLAITALVLSAIALTAGLLVTWQAARAAADPIASVREALGSVEEGRLDVEVPVFDASELGLLQAGFNRMAAGLREREQVRDLFGRHVGADVASAAIEGAADLGGEVVEVGVLFCDIVGSTRMAAERAPHETVALLNSFFAVVVDVVEDNGGYVNKFEGDAALAIFGAPTPLEDPQARALAAARQLARRFASEVPELDAGVGASAGRVLAGNVGAERRFEYTVIGDPVNEAARLTELAKRHPDRVLAAGRAVEAAGAEEAARWELGESASLRGRPEPTRLATPLAE